MEVVTVFGASGFIGRYVVREIARTGARIRVAVRRPDEAGFLKPMGDVGQITPVAANIRDDASVAAAVSGADTVVNLVGLLTESGKQTFGAVHAEGAHRIATAAKAAGTERLIQISAIGADPVSDSTYASTKGAGENLVRDAFADASIVRPSLVFGPEDDFFNKFAMIARLSPVLPLIGGGHTKFQPVYVGDVADAIAAIAGDDRRKGETFELGGPHVYSFRRLMEILLDEIGRKRLLVPMPFCVAALEGAVIERTPWPLLPRDQLISAIGPAPIEVNWQPKRHNRVPGWLWTLGVVLLMLALAAQTAYFRFDTLSKREPWRALYAQVCPLVGCQLPAQVDINALHTSNLVVRSHPQIAGALAVEAVLLNRAPFDQPFPTLQLRFTDLKNAPVASRRFTPQDYLKGELSGRKLMPAGNPVHIALDIVDPGPEAVNYELRIAPQ